MTNYNTKNLSRGHKTKGNTYKERYVQNPCPECGYEKAYKDEWRTRNVFTCMKRSCKHKWYEVKECNSSENNEESI